MATLMIFYDYRHIVYKLQLLLLLLIRSE